ncbi:MAG TPA: MarR family transcriptional regulator [Pedococcus sp.]|nr:MarR family transcriptional regulator [Pedococcus sp.]
MTYRDPTPPAAMEAAIIERLREFTTAMDHYIDAHGGRHGLHRTDLNALGHVMEANRRGEDLGPGELASALNLSAPATSALLARLEGVGHVQRRHSATDRRRVSIEMTDEAMQVGRDVFAPIGGAIRDVIAGFTPEEREVVLRFLGEVVDRTHAAARQAPPDPAAR